MFPHVPNIITGLRLVLAVVFFGMLSWYQYEGRGDPWFLNWAFIVYLVALISDFLDGYLARKYKIESAFGRVVDPFVDKVLVLGSFAFFAGKNFIIPDWEMINTVKAPYVVKTITGVAPYMVVILLGRELLITSLRGIAESSGQSFGAQFSGKLKMVFQSVTILVILAYVNYHDWLRDHGNTLQYATWFRDFCIWATIVITVVSGYTYIQKAIAMYRQDKKPGFEVIPAKPTIQPGPPKASGPILPSGN